MSDNMKEAARIRNELFGIPNNERRIDSFASEIVAMLKPKSAQETSLAFVERMEAMDWWQIGREDADHLIRLAKTAALIEEYKMGVDFMTGNWIAGKDRKVASYPTIHEAVRSVADKIKGAS